MRRILGHSVRLFLGLLLTGLGYGLYETLGPVERWRAAMDGEGNAWHSFTKDGRFIFSGDWILDADSHINVSGPCRKTDAATGAVLSEFPVDVQEAMSDRSSDQPSQRYWAGLPMANRAVLDLFDLENGTLTHFPIDPYAGKRNVIVSARDDIAAVFHFYEHRSEPNGSDRIEKIDIHLHALPNGELIGRFWSVPDEDRGDQLFGAHFSPKGSYFVIPSQDQDGRFLRLWDTHQRKPAGALRVGKWNFLPSAGDRYLLTLETDDKVKLWDLSDLAKPVVVAILPRLHGNPFTPDGRTLVYCTGEEAVFLDCETGKEKGRMPVNGDGTICILPDSKLAALCIISDGRYPGVIVMDVDTCKILWTSQVEWCIVMAKAYFGAGGATLALPNAMDDSHGNFDLELRQARTGQVLASFPNSSGDGWHMIPCANGRRALIQYDSPPRTAPGWFQKKMEEWLPIDTTSRGMWARVIDLQEHREVFRLVDAHEAHDCFLSSDGSILITTHPDSPEGPHVRCYDVPARHPWATIVGIPAVLAIIFWLIEKWWMRRWRKVPTGP